MPDHKQNSESRKHRARSRPWIGVTTSQRGGTFQWWCIRLGVWLAGGKAVRVRPATEPVLDRFQGFVLAGGADIHPTLYGQVSQDPDYAYELHRDSVEKKVVQHAVDEKLPVLGICRGLQMMNVALGGTLHQQVSEVIPDFVPTTSMLAKTLVRRRVSIEPESTLYELTGHESPIKVNSLHHQGIWSTGTGLQVVAREDNGLIQALELTPKAKHPFFLGVQWHPELMLYHPFARRIFARLINKARNHQI